MRIIFRIVLVCFSLSVFSCHSKKEPDKKQIVLGLQKMSDLATAEYVVTKIIKANDNKTWYKIGDRKILMTSKASLVAGIDLSKLTKDDITIDDETITLSLPHAQLLYLNIDPGDIRTIYQEVSLFRTKFSAEEKDALAEQAEQQIRSSIQSMGILVTAETNASIFITNFLRKLGYKNININFSSVNKYLP